MVLSHKTGVRHILFLLILSSLIQLIIPFLTTSIVDIGIENKDINFITIIVIAQAILFLSITSMEFIRKWIVLHIGIRISIELSTSFAKSIMNKKLSYFNNKKDGDILERLIDNNRIESFFTYTALSVFIAVLNLVLFGTLLLIFNLNIFILNNYFNFLDCLFFKQKSKIRS